jgi:NAD(P)-dependent dehydrogenase (short-subunit alcohol dehydrogenase family)
MHDAMFELSGKVALFTGAGRGIGLAMAQSLAEVGCAVAIQDIDLEVAKSEADAINRTGRKAIAYGGDVTDTALPAQLVAEVIRDFGRLDVLVNNAAIQTEKNWIEITANEIERDLRADLITPILFIQQVVPIFRRQRFGRIINIGSIQQRQANGHMFAYSIAKGGLEKVTSGLARELAKDNITINCIAPGWINTYRNRHHLASPEKVQEVGKAHVPIGRLGEPDDFRGIIRLLCGPAGDYITGQSIYVDGGMGA